MGLAGCGAQQPADSHATAPPDVSVVTVSARPVALTKELPGRITPIRIAEVRPRVSGIIIERTFE
jgi:membrane fusion protein, multidrug efflux system